MKNERLCAHATGQGRPFSIWCHIARDNEEAAGRVEQSVYEACAFLAQAPGRGHVRRDLTARQVRFWTLTRYPNYTIVYRPDTVPLEIIAILQGKRNVRRVLGKR